MELMYGLKSSMLFQKEYIQIFNYLNSCLLGYVRNIL